MSTKIIYNSREDKQEIQKQLGCMNGIFQLFDRRYLLGQRRHGHNQKKLAQGESDNGKKEFNNASEKPREKMVNMVVKEKHRVSVESSRNSFSSSCSSFDCSKRVQTEPSSFCPSIISEPESSLEPADIRDVVKDAMTRKPRVVSVKTVAKDDRKGPVMTHVDSPRPLQPLKHVPYDRKDQNLAKLQEISRGVKEVKEISRFSCDGRESPYKLKSIANLKELPRLSLDSKQSSIRNRADVARSSSVVARLMGLEGLTSINGGETLKIKTCLDDELISISRLSKKGEESKQNNVTVSPRARSEARIPLEPAPWKQEGQKQPAKNKKAPERTDHGYRSIYGQIEKRLTEVEFKTSGKDLRALKRILEAIQRTKMRLENSEQESHNSNSDHKETAIKPANLTSDSVVIGSPRKAKKVNHADGRKYTAGRRCTRNLTPTESNATSRTRKPAPSEYLIGQNYCNSRNSGTVSPKPQRSKQSVRQIGKQSNGQITNSKIKSSNPLKNYQNKNKFAESLIEYKPMAELSMLTMEQPSPVSVLDAFYTEDLPSPIQKKSIAFKDDEDLRFDEPAEWNLVGPKSLVSNTEPDQSSSRFNHVKIENIKHLVHQIESLNFIDPHEGINGDHKYIKDILLASGVLKNLDYATTIIHLHPTGSLINPELFDVLEKTQEGNKIYSSSKSEKIKRKLIFDTVNHILVQKLARSPSSGLWTNKRKGRILNGEKLLKELCFEVDNLQTNTGSDLYDEVLNIVTADANKQSEDWDNNCKEVPALVLDIERLIYKDLISEIVHTEVAGLQDRPGRHLRLLFPM